MFEMDSFPKKRKKRKLFSILFQESGNFKIFLTFICFFLPIFFAEIITTMLAKHQKKSSKVVIFSETLFQVKVGNFMFSC
jgi:hypothetical protein